MTALLLIAGAFAADEVELRPSETVPQARAIDAVEDFFVNGDTRRLHKAVAIDPTSGARVHLSRELHAHSRTVTIDGVVVSREAGAEVVRTVRTTDEHGRTTVVTRRESLPR